jgi:hypothetical protein
MTSPEPVANDRLTRCGLIGHISLKKVFSYDAEGVAEWVVFGSTSRELAKANEIINGAEAGDADAALLVGRSLSQGTNGFQIDSINAYKWLSIAVRLGAEGAPSERKRVGARLSPEKRKLVDRRVDDGSF